MYYGSMMSPMMFGSSPYGYGTPTEAHSGPKLNIEPQQPQQQPQQTQMQQQAQMPQYFGAQMNPYGMVQQETALQTNPIPPQPEVPLQASNLQGILANNTSTLGTGEIALGVVEGLAAFCLLKKGGGAAMKKLGSSWSKLTGKASTAAATATKEATATAGNATKAAAKNKKTATTATETADDAKTTFKHQKKTNKTASNETPPPKNGAPKKMTTEQCKEAWKGLSEEQQKRMIGEYAKAIELDAERNLSKTLTKKQRDQIINKITDYINQVIKDGGSIFDTDVKHKVIKIAASTVDGMHAAAKAAV